jgi:hypothetical protein
MQKNEEKKRQKKKRKQRKEKAKEGEGPWVGVEPPNTTNAGVKIHPIEMKGMKIQPLHPAPLRVQVELHLSPRPSRVKSWTKNKME